MTQTTAEAGVEKASNIPTTPSPSISVEPPAGSGLGGIEFPILFRGFWDENNEKAKESWQKMKSASDQYTSFAQGAYSTTVRECTEFGSGMVQTFQENMNANIQFASAMMAARSPSELVEVTSAQTRRQIECTVEQTRQFWSHAEKIATALCQPFAEWRAKMGKSGK